MVKTRKYKNNGENFETPLISDETTPKKMSLLIKMFLTIIIVYIIIIIFRWGYLTEWSFKTNIFKKSENIELLLIRFDIWGKSGIKKFLEDKKNQYINSKCDTLLNNKTVSNKKEDIEKWDEYKNYLMFYNNHGNTKEKILCAFDKWFKNTGNNTSTVLQTNSDISKKCWFIDKNIPDEEITKEKFLKKMEYKISYTGEFENYLNNC